MSQPRGPAAPEPGTPQVVFLDRARLLARWTFATVDPEVQRQEFNYWRGWFGFDERDEPYEMSGDTWLVRKS